MSISPEFSKHINLQKENDIRYAKCSNNFKNDILMVAPMNKNQVLIRIGGKCVPALIDTGSGLCAIKEEFFNKIKTPQNITKPSYINEIRTAGGIAHPVTAQVDLEICIGGLRIKHTFHITSNLMKNVILGIDMLHKNKAYIDFEENTITFPEHEVVCPLLKKGRKYLKTARKIAIPPKQIRTFSVK